jgi:uncharacterized protein YndB with AHSA1/START domain
MAETVRIRRVLPFRRERVFRAWTDPERMKHWMAPFSTSVTEAEIDLRVGGRWRIVIQGEGNDYPHSGEYREIRPPERLVFTWVSPATNGQTTLVTVEFHERGPETELVLTHEGLPDPLARERHEAGWQSIAERLGIFLGTSPEPDVQAELRL